MHPNASRSHAVQKLFEGSPTWELQSILPPHPSGPGYGQETPVKPLPQIRDLDRCARVIVERRVA